MKPLKLIGGLLVLATIMNSCLLTFYPIYSEEDVVYEPSFVGSYYNKDASDGQPDGMQILRLSNAGINLPDGISGIRDKGYFIRFSEKDGRISSECIAFMVVLNKRQYIDFFPYVRDAKQFGGYSSLMIPMHAVYRISLQGKSLTLKRFNQDYLLQMISKKQIRLRHEKIDEKYVITASTEELQQYISKYGDRDEAYEKETEVYTKK